jgi:hypothetical protein
MVISSHHTLRDRKKKRSQRDAPYYFAKIYNFNCVDQIRFNISSFLTLNYYLVYFLSQEYKQDYVRKTWRRYKRRCHVLSWFYFYYLSFDISLEIICHSKFEIRDSISEIRDSKFNIPINQ